MAKKIKFPRVAACTTFTDVRCLLSQIRWKSPEYWALMRRWRVLCQVEIRRLLTYGISAVGRYSIAASNQVVEAWRKLQENSPSGSPEETVAIGLWQNWMPPVPFLELYRRRVCRKAFKAASRLGIKI